MAASLRFRAARPGLARSVTPRVASTGIDAREMNLPVEGSLALDRARERAARFLAAEVFGRERVERVIGVEFPRDRR